MRKLLFFDIFCKRHFWLAIKFQKFTFDWIPNLKFKPWIDIIMRSTHVPFWSHFWAAQQPKTNLCTGHNYGGWFFHYIESQGRWNHFGSLGYLLEFPTGRCNFSGQRDKSSFIVPGQRDNGTSSKSCHGTEQAGTAYQNQGWDVGQDNHYVCQNPGRDAGRDNHYFFSKNGINVQNWKFFIGKVILSQDRGVCPGIFAPVLVPGQRDSGTRKYFCPGTKG